MDKFIEAYFGNFNFRIENRNTGGQLNEAEEELKIIFPKEHRGILELYDGGYGEIGKYYIDLWGLFDVLKFHDDIGEDDMQNMIAFASDGCGMAYVFMRNSEEIRVV